ncbi:7-deoxyloganetin glucosyltransferase-like [Rhododendron vialii]|uniref:7-deoxyloganetin glucosyltransferase-like n=1 Tax=Rhododendron vialii TaxID=182163 RepID=UPI00265D6690|nr:7-deoxyloganetin glucosyltransferase-like [Rhododendron vialii]
MIVFTFSGSNSLAGMEAPLFALGITHILTLFSAPDYAQIKREVQHVFLLFLGVASTPSNSCISILELLPYLDGGASHFPCSLIYLVFVFVMKQFLYALMKFLTPQQLCEFAWGICNSNQPFLWMITPDFAKGQLATLPLEFLEKTKEMGLIATWCPQEQVLAHPSVGVFVSHFGTSSMLESICAGVPMIGWPYFGHDHQVTCRYSCNRWVIGMKINEDIEREEVESLVRELMEGAEGKAMKRKAMEWKKQAVEATSKGGSSVKFFNNLLKALSRSQNFMGHQILSSL